jgi:uncharacterized protein YcnI
MLPRCFAALAVLAIALVPAAAAAHVDVRSGDAGPGSLIVSVPNESDSSDTVSVSIRLPENVVRVRQPAVRGWRTGQQGAPLDPPVTVDGVATGERVRTVTWSGGSLGPGEEVELPLRLWVAQGTPRTGLTLPTVQRYRDGQVVRWIGPEGSEFPAAMVGAVLPTLVVAATAPGTTPTETQADPAAATLTAAEEDDSSPVVLALIIAAVAAVGIVLIAFLVRRMRRRPPVEE